jgi:dTDP-glucose 4,6-dehydratase
MKRVLITGAAGFIGHHVVDHVLQNTDWEIVLLDRLDCSGSVIRFQESKIFQKHKNRCTWVWWDLKSPLNGSIQSKLQKIDYVFHLAAGSHVDRSITYPMEFVYDNIVGTGNLLDWAKAAKDYHRLEKFIYFSTDEVFGPAELNDEFGFDEESRYNSRNPYAASKAGAEQLCVAYENTYKVPVIITRCMNNFGERQNIEKYIPMTIKNILDGKIVTIHSNAEKTMSGSRYYIHARNTAAAVMFLVENGKVGEKYNIVGEQEVTNLDMAYRISKILNKPLQYHMVDFHSSRPGHDLRYAMDGRKMNKMGWKIPVSFDVSLEKTVLWTAQHSEWLM